MLFTDFPEIIYLTINLRTIVISDDEAGMDFLPL